MHQKLKRFLSVPLLAVLFVGVVSHHVQAHANTGIVILAAGLGSRMKSELPKALQEIQGKPMIAYVLEAIKAVAEDSPVAIVVGYKKELVQRYILEQRSFRNMKITFVEQPKQLGTGHAARCAMDSEWGAERMANHDDVLVLPGDMPLITPQMIAEMVAPLPIDVPMKLLTTVLANPYGYGRIVRDEMGQVLRIVEEKDADDEQKTIREVGVSIYTFDANFLHDGLGRLDTKNAQKEFYLTDLVAIASSRRGKIPVVIWKNEEDLRGVNTVDELKQAADFMLKRLGLNLF